MPDIDTTQAVPRPSSALELAFAISEVLEHVFFFLPKPARLVVRFVSRRWNAVMFRVLAHYPDLKSRGMNHFRARLAKQGSLTLELDFLQSRLYSEKPHRDVEFLKAHCPNVQVLKFGFGSFTFVGTTMLMTHWSKQLTSLTLDCSRTTTQPNTMDIFDGMSRLKILEVRLNESGWSRINPCFWSFTELLQRCPSLSHLTVSPLPPIDMKTKTTTSSINNDFHSSYATFVVDGIAGDGWEEHMGQQHQQQAKNDFEGLLAFEKYRPNLIKLHLPSLVFDDEMIQRLATACPRIRDLGIRTTVSTLELFTQTWPSLQRLDVSGSMTAPPARSLNVSSQDGILRQSNSLTKFRLLGFGQRSLGELEISHISTWLTGLSLKDISQVDDDCLRFRIVPFVPRLEILNVDGCQQLGNKGLIAVLRSCPHLLRLSAREVDLTMGLFEEWDDDGQVSFGNDTEQIHCGQPLSEDDEMESLTTGLSALSSNETEVDMSMKAGTATRKAQRQLTPWACRNLQFLDLSWTTDGRPRHVSSHRNAENAARRVRPLAAAPRPGSQSNGSTAAPQVPVRFGAPPPPPPPPPPPLPGSVASAGNPNQQVRQQQEWSRNSSAGDAQRLVRDSLRKRQWESLPMFRDPWTKNSFCRRIVNHQKQLRTLVMEGWVISWEVEDIEAFTGAKNDDEGQLSSTSSMSSLTMMGELHNLQHLNIRVYGQLACGFATRFEDCKVLEALVRMFKKLDVIVSSVQNKQVQEPISSTMADFWIYRREKREEEVEDEERRDFERKNGEGLAPTNWTIPEPPRKGVLCTRYEYGSLFEEDI